MEPQEVPKQQHQVLEEIGDVKAYLTTVAGKIAEIKEAKIQQSKLKNSEGILERLSGKVAEEQLKKRQLEFSMRIPEELYKLDERLRKV